MPKNTFLYYYEWKIATGNIYKIGKKGLPSIQILHMVAEMYFSSFRDIQKDLRDFLSCRLGNYASLLRVKGIHRLGLLLSFKRCPEPYYFLQFVNKKKYTYSLHCVHFGFQKKPCYAIFMLVGLYWCFN